MFLCRTFEYPVVPQNLLYNIQLEKIVREYPARTCQINNQEFTTSHGVSYEVDKELETWVKNNIDLDIDSVVIRYQYGTPEHNSQGAHTDATRKYVLLYTIDNAGGHLQFWQQENNPLELDTLNLITDYNTLTKVESFDIPNNQWYLVNGQVLHSVENITHTRITLQVNLKSI